MLKSWLKSAEKEVKSVREQPVLHTFEIELSTAEINRLDEEWAKNRRRVGQQPDLYDLYELLRTVGRYVDSENGQLVRISKDSHRLVLQFRDRNNSLKTLECSMLSLYKNQQKMIAERGTFTIKDIWEHRDW